MRATRASSSQYDSIHETRLSQKWTSAFRNRVRERFYESEVVKLISIHPVALGGPSYPKAGLKRLPDKVLKSRTPNYEKFIFITSPTLSRTTLFMLMNLDAISELGSDEQAGHH